MSDRILFLELSPALEHHPALKNIAIFALSMHILSVLVRRSNFNDHINYSLCALIIRYDTG